MPFHIKTAIKMSHMARSPLATSDTPLAGRILIGGLKIVIAFVLICLIVFALVMLLTHSQGKEIEELVDKIYSYAVSYDAESIIAFVSKNYSADGQKYDDFIQKIRRYINPSEYRGLQLRERFISVLGETATVDASVNVTSNIIPGRSFFTLKVKAQFTKEQGKWLITTVNASADSSNSLPDERLWRHDAPHQKPQYNRPA